MSLKYFVLLAFATAFCGGDTLAQRKSPPTFGDFPVKQTFKGNSARVNLQSHPKARMYRTMLRKAAQDGPNFAGHYAVTYAGCGTECKIVAIVDVRNGNAYFVPFEMGFGPSVRVDSRLFIVNPPEELKPPYYEPEYYVWEGNQLRLIFPKKARKE